MTQFLHSPAWRGAGRSDINVGPTMNVVGGGRTGALGLGAVDKTDQAKPLRRFAGLRTQKGLWWLDAG